MDSAIAHLTSAGNAERIRALRERALRGVCRLTEMSEDDFRALRNTATRALRLPIAIIGLLLWSIAIWSLTLRLLPRLRLCGKETRPTVTPSKETWQMTRIRAHNRPSRSAVQHGERLADLPGKATQHLVPEKKPDPPSSNVRI
jgi:hypothetical protein